MTQETSAGRSAARALQGGRERGAIPSVFGNELSIEGPQDMSVFGLTLF